MHKPVIILIYVSSKRTKIPAIRNLFAMNSIALFQ